MTLAGAGTTSVSRGIRCLMRGASRSIGATAGDRRCASRPPAGPRSRDRRARGATAARPRRDSRRRSPTRPAAARSPGPPCRARRRAALAGCGAPRTHQASPRTGTGTPSASRVSDSQSPERAAPPSCSSSATPCAPAGKPRERLTERRREQELVRSGAWTQRKLAGHAVLAVACGEPPGKLERRVARCDGRGGDVDPRWRRAGRQRRGEREHRSAAASPRATRTCW